MTQVTTSGKRGFLASFPEMKPLASQSSATSYTCVQRVWSHLVSSSSWFKRPVHLRLTPLDPRVLLTSKDGQFVNCLSSPDEKVQMTRFCRAC